VIVPARAGFVALPVRQEHWAARERIGVEVEIVLADQVFDHHLFGQSRVLVAFETVGHTSYLQGPGAAERSHGERGTRLHDEHWPGAAEMRCGTAER
jgi:hypothetical protein